MRTASVANGEVLVSGSPSAIGRVSSPLAWPVSFGCSLLVSRSVDGKECVARAGESADKVVFMVSGPHVLAKLSALVFGAHAEHSVSFFSLARRGAWIRSAFTVDLVVAIWPIEAALRRLLREDPLSFFRIFPPISAAHFNLHDEAKRSSTLRQISRRHSPIWLSTPWIFLLSRVLSMDTLIECWIWFRRMLSP